MKFANYFLSRKNVHQAKGAVHLLEALKAFSENGFHNPVSISLDGAATVSESSPKVRVRVSNLLGQSIGKADVVIESAMRQSDGVVILANSKMNEAGEGIYEIDMQAAKPGFILHKLNSRKLLTCTIFFVKVEGFMSLPLLLHQLARPKMLSLGILVPFWSSRPSHL